MRKVLIFLFLVVLNAAHAGATQPVPADDQPASIKEALRKSLCYELYWQGQKFQVGVPLPLQVKILEGRFLAWVDDLKATHHVRMSGFFMGRVKDGRSIAVLTRGYNPDLSPQAPGYAEDRQHFVAGAMKDTLTIPADCTPRYDPPTAEKARKLKTVVSTMQKQISSLVRMGAARYPPEITLIVADFNIDYPSTYVLVEPAGDLYTLTLHDPEDYDSDLYERQGEYPLRWVRVAPHLRDLLGKIRRHGIIQKILLTP